MINIEMARDYLVRARRCLREAELAYREGDAPSTVRRAQECLELAVKSLLRLLGVEYPKVHDVSDVLLEVREKLPSPLRERVGELAQLVAELFSVRGPPSMAMRGRAFQLPRLSRRDMLERCLRRLELSMLFSRTPWWV